MKIHITYNHNKQELRVTAKGELSGSVLDWETDYSNLIIMWGKVNVTSLLEDTDLIEKIYQELDKELFTQHFGLEVKEAA